MFRTDDPSAVAVLPAAGVAGTPGYFTGGDPVGGIPATVVTADFLNMLQEEVISVLVAAGIAPSKAIYNQLLTSIKTLIDAQSGNYALDTGLLNAPVIALDPPIAAYVNGMTVRFRIKFANTAGCTLNAGAGVVPLLNDLGGALIAGDVPLNALIAATYDTPAGAFVINSLVTSQALSQAAADARYMAITAGLNFNGIASAAITTIWTKAASVGKFIYITAAGATTQTLPLASTFSSGQAIVFFNNGTGTPTFARQGTDGMLGVMGGGTSFVLNPTEAVILTTDGVSWFCNFLNGATGLPPRTRQDVTASRVVVTTYQNLTGRPIWVSVLFNVTAGAAASLTVDGVVTQNGSNGGGSTANISLAVEVLHGSTYSAGLSGGSLTRWTENR